MKKIVVAVGIAALLLIALVGVGAARYISPQASAQALSRRDVIEQHGEALQAGPAASGVTDPVIAKELAAVRQATAKYQDVNVALADGFIRTPNCVADPKLGGMGIHFVNPPRLMDPAEDILKPEILLYVEKDGAMKLLGVEYFYGIGAPDAAVPNPAPPSPILFNRVFNGPMLGHEPGQPPHYDLHVWIWQANPSGMFAQYNPNVKCK